MELYRRLRIDESGIGQKFGRLTVIGPWFSLRDNSGAKRPHAVCRCDCGNVTTTLKRDLLRGKTGTCGCGNGDRIRELNVRRTKHGQYRNNTETAEIKAWRSMLFRCENENAQNFQDYGGRGITVCQKWKSSFEAFLEDVGPRPSPKHSLGRIDNDGNYDPGNVRWETDVQQSRNKRTNTLLSLNGVTRTAVEWSEVLGIRRGVIYLRLRAGWTAERALTEPVRKRTRRR